MLIKQNQLVINGTTLEQSDLQAIANVASDVQAQIDTKAPINNAQFTGNVGIGTNSPASTLDTGYTRIYNSGAASSPSSGKGLEVHYVTSGRTQGEGAYLIPYDRDNGQYKPLTIDAITTRVLGGNTLIGPNSLTDSFTASQRLHVYDPSTAYILAETGGTGTSAGHRSTAGSNDWVWFATEGQPNYRLYDYSSSAVRLTVKNDGNVGIGTTSPEVKLEVNGGADGSVVFAGRSDGGNGNNRRFNLIAYADGGGANYGGGLKIQTRSSTNIFADAITVQSNGDVKTTGSLGVTQTDGDYLAKLYQSSADGFLELYTGEATPVSRVKLSAYGNSYIAPSTTSGFGVGTTAPQERLHVVGDIQQQSTHNSADKCIEAFFNIATNTSYNTVWTANINNQHQGMFYEVICYGGDWGSHSSARVIKRGFVNGYNGYSGHQEIESAGPYASNISGQLLWSSNTVTYQMRLDTGSVTLRGMVRLIGHFTGYTVY